MLTLLTVFTVLTVLIVETVKTVETEITENLKKYHLLTHSLTDNLKARDASASKNKKMCILAAEEMKDID